MNFLYPLLCPSFIITIIFIFFGERPRSRRYGRTAALRLIVQPCDEDNYFSFLFFRVTEQRWNKIHRVKPKYWGEKLIPVPLSLPQIPHGLARDRTQACVMGGRRLTAWAMPRSLFSSFLSSSSSSIFFLCFI
jgi:hypothetical protein